MKKLFTISALILSIATFTGCASTIPPQLDGIFYPSLPEKPKIQYLHSITQESDIGAQQSNFDKFILGPTQEFIGVTIPYDITSIKNKIFAIDRGYEEVFIFDLLNKKLTTLEDSFHSKGDLIFPTGIWVSQDGVKYVADTERKEIVVYTPDNKFKRTYGDDTIFEKPTDLCIVNNKLYVVDNKKHQIIVLDIDTGAILKTFGEPGEEHDFQLNRPIHITPDNEGNVYVTDAFNFKIKKFSPEGEFLQSFGSHGDGIGQFARPKGIAVDRQGRLYAVDAATGYVQIFDKDGKLLLFFPGPGKEIHQLWLPAGIAIDYDNVDYFRNFADKNFKIEYLIYVSNMAGPGRTNVYGFGEFTGDSN